MNAKEAMQQNILHIFSNLQNKVIDPVFENNRKNGIPDYLTAIHFEGAFKLSLVKMERDYQSYLKTL